MTLFPPPPMSASLQPQNPVPSAIAPHLLHSTGNPHSVDMHSFMDACHNAASASPHSITYTQSPALDSRDFQHEPHPPSLESVTSPSGLLVVHSYRPASARPGAELTAQVDVNGARGGLIILRIVFGGLSLCTEVVENVPPQEREPGQEWCYLTLKSVVPHESQVSAHMAEMGPDGRLEWPLALEVLNKEGVSLEKMSFGLFAYENAVAPPNLPYSSLYDFQSGYKSSSKRPRQDDGDYSPPTKRLVMNTDFPRTHVNNSFVGIPQIAHRAFFNTPSPISSSLRTGISIPQQVFRPHLQPSNHLESQIQSHQSEMPTLPLPEVPPVPSSPGARSDDSPALIRTSQLGHDTKPEQASVAFETDLEKMKDNWSHNETLAGRRLVQFWKQQVGTTLHISCKTILQNDYKENTIVVSCIYRDPEYFITSVDVISLLEALAGNRFEVEEKNRIRRNLEGFKPMTISKTKPGTEEFFRVIMEMPAPRPRNIEKDVKVFEWGKLKMMMEKVFSKYSTVPISQNAPSPKYDESSHGASSSLHPFPKTLREGSSELPNFTVPPVRVRHRTQKRYSPRPSERLRDVPSLPPLHASLQNQRSSPTYSEHFLPSQYTDYEEDMSSAEFPYGIFDLLGQTPLFKPDLRFANEHVNAPANVERHHDGFGSGPPPSSDNSPLSMTLSISSGTSSEGGHVENQELAPTPRIPGAPEPLHISHQQL